MRRGLEPVGDGGAGVAARNDEWNAVRLEAVCDREGHLALEVEVQDGAVDAGVLRYLLCVAQRSDRTDDVRAALLEGARQVVGEVVLVLDDQDALARKAVRPI